MSSYRIDPNKLKGLCEQVFRNLGETAEGASIISDALIDANLRGVSSHGVIRVGNYVDRVLHGGTKVCAEIEVLKQTAFSATIDANNGFGFIAAEKAVQIARTNAKNVGFGMALVRNSNHYGAAAHWSLKLAEDDMVGMSASNVEPVVAVTGSKVAGIGNNPISFAFPTKSFGCICYDVACSVMALGKMFESRAENRRLPEDSFMDSDGAMTTDPHKAAVSMPFGGHKGYGLAVVVEMLTSILSGGQFGNNVGKQYLKLDTPNNLSHIFMAINIECFRSLSGFREDADGFINYLHELPRAVNVGRIYYPGEIEAEKRSYSETNGIVLPQSEVEDLIKYALQAGIDQEKLSFLTKNAIE